MPIFFAYDNTSLTDGFGAQVLRQVGIFSLAKFLGCSYLHSPIKETIEEFAHNVKSEEELDSLMEKVNDFFELPSDPAPLNFDKVLTFRDVGIRKLLVCLFRYRFSTQNVLIRILLPFGCTNRLPSMNKIAVRHIRKRNASRFSEHTRNEIVVHVRLGYGQRTPVAENVPPRYLPLEYYVKVLRKVIDKNSNDSVSYKALIHTDLAPTETTWKPTAKRLEQNRRFGEKVGIAGDIFIQGTNISNQFEDIPQLITEIKHCDDFFTTFLDMACADVLIVSRSAFSYLAGLFNEATVIWPENHGHAKLFRWISSSRYNIQLDFDLLRG